MSFKIEFGNSYCYIKSDDSYVLNIIHNTCSVVYYYFTKDWRTKKPTKKRKELVFYSLEDGKYKFPRGWFWDVHDSLAMIDEVIVSDIRKPFKLEPINSEEMAKVTLYPYQVEATDAAIDFRYGVIHHTTGSGKTLLAANIIDKVGPPGVIIVPSRLLLYQTRDVMEKFFPGLKIGLVGDGEFSIGDITVGTSDSLFLKLDKVKSKLKKGLQFLFADEVQHVREAKDLNTRYYDVVMGLDASMKIGLTATPGDPGTIKRSILEAATGGVIHYLDDEEARAYGIIVDMEVYIISADVGPYIKHYSGDADWQFEYKKNMLDQESYHKQVRDIAKSLVDKGLSTLIIVDRVGKHLKVLEKMIPEAEVLYGDTERDVREDIKEQFEANKIPLLISTIIKEGVNIKNIEAIIMAGGGKDSDALIQKIGRGLRWKEGKDKLILVDFMFDDGILNKHSKSRIQTYNKKGYKVHYVSEI